LIESIFPDSGPTIGGTALTINGSGFGSSPKVTLGSSVVTLTSATDTRLIVATPEGQGTGVQVRVEVDGRLSAPLPFAYNPPLISQLIAGSAPTAGGTVITLTGSNFGLTPSVTVGGRVAPVLDSGHSMLTASLPAGQGVDQPVVLTVGGQVSNTLTLSYDPPVIDSLSPASAATSGGTLLTVRGTGFGFTPTVTIQGRAAELVSAASHTQLVCRVPAGNVGSGEVRVTVEGRVSNALTFTYESESFDRWAESIDWGGLDSSLTADPRSTGWTNLQAYALGVDPTATTGGETASRTAGSFGWPAMSRSPDGRLQLSFWRRRADLHPDLIYEVRFTDALSANAWEPATLEPQVEIVDEVWEFCVFTDHSQGSGKRFGQLKVSHIQP
jgi:hypothetical protein